MASALPPSTIPAAHEHRLMGEWIFDIPDTGAARALFAALPAEVAGGVELRTCFGQARLRAPTEAAARWVREHVAVAA